MQENLGSLPVQFCACQLSPAEVNETYFWVDVFRIVALVSVHIKADFITLARALP